MNLDEAFWHLCAEAKAISYRGPEPTGTPR